MKKHAHKIALITGVVGALTLNNALALNLRNSASSSLTEIKKTEIIVTDQVSKQVGRQISNVIASRITNNINPSFSMPNNAKGAGDGLSLKPDSLWSTFSWSRLSNDGRATSAFDTDIYQSTSGVDKKFGNFYLGVSLVYAAALTDFSNAQHDTQHSVSITPYAAYVLNKNFFISAFSGYLYTNSDPTFALQSNTHSNITEIDFNGLHVINQWFMKGKVGGRYQHGYTRTDAVAGAKAELDNTDSWTFLTEATGGYAFQNGIRVSTGILYELSNRQNGLTLPGTTLTTNAFGENSVFYYNAGLDYSLTKSLTLGSNVQTDLSNPTIDLTTVSINARLAL